ncbi:MAG TPA: hypothetical protein VFP44_25225 [Usitatibacter sp.]|nr:hypothetical protein [Usitatibacter sp.]
MTIHTFHAKNDHHRSAITWHSLLESSQGEQDVLRVARDFIASFTPHEIELLPASCRPGKLVDGQDVALYGYELTLHRWDEDEAAAPVIQSFASFFADATEHLARIARQAQGDDERESA